MIGALSVERAVDERCAVEAPQPVALLQRLARARRPFREHQHQLLLVEQQPVDVGGVRDHAAELREQHPEAGNTAEMLLGRQMHGPPARMLLLDRLRNHCRVRRQRAGMVGDEQRGALGRDVHDPFDLDAKPVAVQKVVNGAVDQPLDALGASPVAEVPVGLDPGELVAEVGQRRGHRHGAAGDGDLLRFVRLEVGRVRVQHARRFLHGASLPRPGRVHWRKRPSRIPRGMLVGLAVETTSVGAVDPRALGRVAHPRTLPLGQAPEVARHLFGVELPTGQMHVRG